MSDHNLGDDFGFSTSNDLSKDKKQEFSGKR